MSRSGYSDDCENMNLYRGTVERAIAGKRGQRFLQGLAKALDEMPEKRLIADELINGSGEVCAIGAFCKSKGIPMEGVDYENPERVGRLVDISSSMAAEIEYENDEFGDETPEKRWERMRKWVASEILESKES